MRYTTKHKLWGRNQLVVTLRSMVQDLDQAQKALDEHDITELRQRLSNATIRCKTAAEGMDIYKVERKRIRAALERERKNLAAIMELAKAIPVTQGEKAVAKVARIKRKRGKA